MWQGVSAVRESEGMMDFFFLKISLPLHSKYHSMLKYAVIELKINLYLRWFNF